MKKTESLSFEPLVIDVATAAKLLNVCERTIRNLSKRGELPVVRIAGRTMYRPEDLKEFVRQRLQRASNDGKTDSPQSL
jgi:excisionase family DNA binding protein